MIQKPSAVTFWQAVGTRFLPFADAASTELPLGRLLRLALFQVSVGIAAVLLNGTLNRVLIVELKTPTWITRNIDQLEALRLTPSRCKVDLRRYTHRRACDRCEDGSVPQATDALSQIARANLCDQYPVAIP